jgi:hypothetical protein
VVGRCAWRLRRQRRAQMRRVCAVVREKKFCIKAAEQLLNLRVPRTQVEHTPSLLVHTHLAHFK